LKPALLELKGTETQNSCIGSSDKRRWLFFYAKKPASLSFFVFNGRGSRALILLREELTHALNGDTSKLSVISSSCNDLLG
jgi:hypothetical protein